MAAGGWAGSQRHISGAEGPGLRVPGSPLRKNVSVLFHKFPIHRAFVLVAAGGCVVWAWVGPSVRPVLRDPRRRLVCVCLGVWGRGVGGPCLDPLGSLTCPIPSLSRGTAALRTPRGTGGLVAGPWGSCGGSGTTLDCSKLLPRTLLP